jgi:hypothetical protein
VEEAIKFYQTYRNPAFARSTLVIVDKTGADGGVLVRIQCRISFYFRVCFKKFLELSNGDFCFAYGKTSCNSQNALFMPGSDYLLYLKV